ncbi:hypothetical protein CBW46_009090 [Paenibacillus xerothermodurans]|uniref:HipA-like kinase domain-containing protein n=2 Tax=Paenibacillus xerothermodurans TaxID=1977292 RepID=A0A2W1P2X3_PAEXE|nr:hypothetical protein CBW46_009090 [Paenibacillus xerothermodurans]
MARAIQPVRLIKGLPGKARPQLILFNDGCEYVVKFKNNRQGTRVLVNEYVVGRLAKLLNLPIVPFKVVSISQKFIKANKRLARRRLKAGRQFASLYLDHCVPLSQARPPGRRQLRNADQLKSLIAFDHWVNNTDRGRGNILVDGYSRSRRVYIIDHANCFTNGFKWTKKSLKVIPQKTIKRRVHRWCATLFKDRKTLLASIKKIKAIRGSQIRKIIDSIPADWGVTAAEKHALYHHILQSRKTLRKRLAVFVSSKTRKKSSWKPR